MSPIVPMFVESLLAAICGVPVETFAEGRKKIAPKNWRLAGGHVAYEKTGALEVLLVLGLAETTPGGEIVSTMGEELETILAAALMQAPATEPEKTAAIQARVVGFALNPRMLRCKRLDSKALVLVMVTKRENFRQGMEVPIREVAKRPYYELVGPLPRNKGRW